MEHIVRKDAFCGGGGGIKTIFWGQTDLGYK
jgi:hypothetical protein